jgi:hypothetical protein
MNVELEYKIDRSALAGDSRYCYPLTITDFASRYLLTCEALSTTQEKFAFTVFERTFTEFGLPHTIRTDTTACPLPPPTRSMASASSPSGGSASASTSSASNPGILSKTAGTNVCILR